MLKTIAGLQGVTILSKESQKKVKGGTGCGVVLFNSAGNAVDFSWSIDTDHDGRTKDQAIEEMNAYNNANPGGYYHARYCCASCSNYA